MKTRKYIGESRDILSSPWLRLVKGARYYVDKHETHSGKIRLRVSDGVESARVTYPSQRAFEREWL